MKTLKNQHKYALAYNTSSREWVIWNRLNKLEYKAILSSNKNYVNITASTVKYHTPDVVVFSSNDLQEVQDEILLLSL